MTIEKFVTTTAIAKRLGISCDWVLTWIRSGKLRAVNLSDGHWRFDYFVSGGLGYGFVAVVLLEWNIGIAWQ